MIQALLAAARAVPTLLRATGGAAGKAAPAAEKGAAKSLPRGANEVGSKAASPPGGKSPTDFLNTAMNLVGMGDLVSSVIPKKPAASPPPPGAEGPKGAA